MKTKLVVVRHGESMCNLEGRLQGQYDSPLSPLGIRQAWACGEYLSSWHFDAAYSSDLSRANNTAKMIAERHPGLEVSKVAALREIFFGKWQNMLPSEIAVKYADDYAEWKTGRWGVRPTGGETLAEVAERACTAVWEIAARHAGGTVLIVTHNGPMRMLQCDWFGIPYERVREVPHAKNVGVYVLEYDLEARTVERIIMGETGFLEGITVNSQGDRY